MFANLKLFPVILVIHDGDAGAAPTAGTQASGLGNPTPSGETVVYGKQDHDAGDKTTKTPAERKTDFERLINDEYKDEYSKHFNDTFNKRFKDYKSNQERLEALNPLLDVLSAKYQIKDADPKKIVEAFENDSRFYEELADDAGLTVEQYKKALKQERQLMSYQKAEQERLQAARNDDLRQQETEMRTLYPNFDLVKEITTNADFATLISAGATVKAAYNAVHFDEVASGLVTAAGKRAEQNVKSTIAAKGQRPTEAGASGTPGVIVKDDPSKFSVQDLFSVAEKVKRGETIKF